MVSSKQIQNSTLQPYLRKTPRGGKRMAKRISMQVAVPSAIFLFSSLLFLKISSPKVLKILRNGEQTEKGVWNGNSQKKN
uniref:Cold induced plasma membrane protein n=1 Tax=Rhizophora mucronata TaxID=61149 RepID=A0A2P2K9A5_RHIMU